MLNSAINWGAVLKLAKGKPAGVTVAVMFALAACMVWGMSGGLARGKDLAELEAKVNAHLTEFAELKDDVRNARLEGLEGQLFEARVAQCRAESEELKQVYAERVTKLMRDYRAAGGRDITLPDCDDL